jgi:hypothetical protein
VLFLQPYLPLVEVKVSVGVCLLDLLGLLHYAPVVEAYFGAERISCAHRVDLIE